MEKLHSSAANRAGGFRIPPSEARLVARGLGWFSIGLGLAECLMPLTMARAVGLPGKENLLRAFGAREIATGLGILLSRDPEPWIWGRVAGDMLDLGALSAGLRPENRNRTGTVVAMLAVAQVTVADVACAGALRRAREARGGTFIDYGDRGGFARPALEMRGAALSSFQTPAGYRIPEAMRPWDDGNLPGGGLSSDGGDLQPSFARPADHQHTMEDKMTGIPKPGEPSDMNPGDEVPPGSPDSGENVCPACHGTGQLAGKGECANCGGTGKIIQGIGGA